MRCSEQSQSCRMGVPVTSTRQEKEMKRMPSGQEEMKLPLLAEEMTVYIDNLQGATKFLEQLVESYDHYQYTKGNLISI